MADGTAGILRPSPDRAQDPGKEAVGACGARLDRNTTEATLVPTMTGGTVRQFWRDGWGSAGALTLLVGMLALAVPPQPFSEHPTWETLLAPYSTGASLP